MTLSPSGTAFCMTGHMLECRKCGVAAGSGMTRIKDSVKNAENDGANECQDRVKERKKTEGRGRRRSQLSVLMHCYNAVSSLFFIFVTSEVIVEGTEKIALAFVV